MADQQYQLKGFSWLEEEDAAVFVDSDGAPSLTEGIYSPHLRTVTVTPDVLVFCHVCHDVEAPEYRLRRSGGKYVALCYKQGTGCWEQSPNPMCDYKDHQGVQCTMIAEWDIRYGRDMLDRSVRCLIHVAPALGDVGEHRISAL